MDIKKIKENVKDILVRFPESRNNDKDLLFNYIITYLDNYLEYYNSLPFLPLKALYNIQNLDSITRLRRLVQREEYDDLKKKLNMKEIEKIDYSATVYLPTDIKVLRRRRFLQEEYKNILRR